MYERPLTAVTQQMRQLKPASAPRQIDQRPTTAIHGQQFHFTNEPVRENKSLLKEIARKRPKIAKLEEEELTQEQLRLNNQLQSVLKEREELQQQLQTVEQQRERYQKLIYEIEDFVDKKKGMKIGQGESWLVIKLKNQINELNTKIEQRGKQIEELKKKPVYTKRQETQIMIDYLNYFTQAIRNNTTQKDVIDQTMDEATAIFKLEKEIQEMEVTYAQLQEQNEQLQIQKTIWDKKVSQQYLKLDKTKDEVKEREKDLHYLRNEIKKFEENAKQQDQQKNNKVKAVQPQIKKVDSQQNQKSLDLDDKKAEIIEREQIIAQQERIINDLKERLQERTNYELKSKNDLHDELNELKTQVHQMRSTLQELKDYYYNEIQPLETENLPIIQGNKDHTFTILHDILNKQEKKYQRVPRVNQEEIEDLGKEISLRLQIKQIPIEDAASLLIGDKVSIKGVMVQDLQDQLLQEPFHIADPHQALLLARFMVEDNTQEFVNLDPEACQKVPVIKSVFRKLVGCYVLLDSGKDKRLWDEIMNQIVKFEAGIRQQFDNIPNSKLGFITPKELFNAFNALFIELTDQQQEYVLLRLFAYTNNIHKIQHMKLFDVFKPGAYIDRINQEASKKVNTSRRQRFSISSDRSSLTFQQSQV